MSIISMYSGRNLQVFVTTAVKHALILSNKTPLQCKIQYLDLKAHAKQSLCSSAHLLVTGFSANSFKIALEKYLVACRPHWKQVQKLLSYNYCLIFIFLLQLHLSWDLSNRGVIFPSNTGLNIPATPDTGRTPNLSHHQHPELLSIQSYFQATS